MQNKSYTLCKFIIIAAAVLLLGGLNRVNAQTDCADRIKSVTSGGTAAEAEEIRQQISECCNFETVEEELDLGNTDNALLLLKICLNSDPGFTEVEQKITAYEKMALIYIEKDNRSKAETAIAKILNLNKTYEPGPYELIPEFDEMVRREKQRRVKQQSKKWYWIGGAAVTAGVAAVLLLSSGGDKQLPGPPGPPGSN